MTIKWFSLLVLLPVLILPVNAQEIDGPDILNVIVDDPSHKDQSISNGDTITVIFSESTNMPNVQTRQDVDKLITFSHNIGKNYSGEFISPTTLLITITDVDDADSFDLGQFQIKMNEGGGLKNSSGTSRSSVAESSIPLGSFAGFVVTAPIELNSDTITVPLPFGLTMDWDFPPNVSGKVQVSSTQFQRSITLGNKTQNLLGASDVTPCDGANCSEECSISFRVTEDDLKFYGFQIEELRIYRDENNNDSFESGDELKTTFVKNYDKTFLVSAKTSFNSKFAIGGVQALFLAGIAVIHDDTLLSLKQQIHDGIAAEKITCKNNLELIIKKNTHEEKCVKTQHKGKFIQRGYGIAFD